MGRPDGAAGEERVMRNRVKMGGLSSGWLAGIHRSGIIDYIGDSASGKLNLSERLVVEKASGVKIEIGLVGFKGRLKERIEEIGEIRRRGNVAKSIEVSFEIREAIEAITRAAAFEFLELVPSTSGFVKPRWD